MLPSDGGETWGLVVNEAMACGLPAVVSVSAGCSADLVEEGKTGFTFPMGDVTSLADRIIQLSNLLQASRTQIRASVESRIRRYSVEAAVEGTSSALAHVARQGSAREVLA